MISIIIPTYNRYEKLMTLLQSLEESIKKCSINENEIIVVNDGSIDETKNLKDTHFYKVLCQENSGAAKARNSGAKIAKKKFILFLDDDCIVKEDYFNKVNEELKINTFDIGYGNIFHYEKSEGFIAKYMKEIGFLESVHFDSNGNYSCIPSTNMIIKKNFFYELNGFSTFFNSAGGEDDYLTQLAVEKKAKIVHLKSLNVFHDNTNDIFSFIKRYYNYGQGHATLCFHKKYTYQEYSILSKTYVGLILKILPFLRKKLIENQFKLEKKRYLILYLLQLISHQIGATKKIQEMNK